jgi:hypothetical protein
VFLKGEQKKEKKHEIEVAGRDKSNEKGKIK